jgi:hypothetical protein
MVEAVFDFSNINRRMNRKPVIAAVEPPQISMADVAVYTPTKKSKIDIINEAMFKIRYDEEFERFKEAINIPPVYNDYDPSKKRSYQPINVVYDGLTDTYQWFDK